MNELSDIAKQALMQPQEAMLETRTKKNSLYIGIPKETSYQEKRIALTPLSVAVLVNNGHEVVIEAGAGKAANFLDHHYSEQGARIVYDKKEVYKADLIVKIAPPTAEEVELMKHGQVLFSSAQMSSVSIDCLRLLMKKKITALSYEYLRDEGGRLAVVRAMSEIVGATSILIAGEYLSNI